MTLSNINKVQNCFKNLAGTNDFFFFFLTFETQMSMVLSK